MNDEPNVASSAATTEVAEPVEVEDLNEEQHASWLKTGDLPTKETKTKPEDSSTSKPAEKAADDTTDADGKIAESGTAKKGKTDERFQELLRERKEAKERADRLEAELAELRKKSEGGGDGKKADSSTAKPAVNQPAAPEKPKRPRLADFEEYEVYEAALDKYEEAMLEFPKKKADYEQHKAQFDKRLSEIQTRESKITETWKSIAEEGRKIYDKDWDKAAFEPTLPIVEGDPVERYLRDSEPATAAHMLQYLGLNKADLERINGLSARQQFKEMEALEQAISEELGTGSKTPAVTAKKKAPQQQSTVKRVSDSKKPPEELGGKGTAAGDEEEAALRHGTETGDYTRYHEIVNKREIARKKAGR